MSARRYSDAELIGRIRRFADRLGRTPKAPEMTRAHGMEPSITAYQARFGSWRGALRAAGLALSPLGRIPRDVCGAGHPLTADNLILHPRTGRRERRCRTCIRARRRAYERARRGTGHRGRITPSALGWMAVAEGRALAVVAA